MGITDPFRTRRIYGIRFSKDITLNLFRGRFALPKKIGGRDNVQGTALRGYGVNSGALVRGIRGCVSGCFVNSSYFVRGIGIVCMRKESSFKGGIRISMLGRAKNHRMPVCGNLSTSLTCLVTLCHRQPTLVLHLRTVVTSFTRQRANGCNFVNGRIGVVGAKAIHGAIVTSCTAIRGYAHLSGNAIGDGIGTPICVNSDIVTRSFVVSSKTIITSTTGVVHYFVKRTYRIARGFSTRSSLLFDGYTFRGKRTYTVFTKPFAISVRGDDLLVTNVCSFLGTKDNSGRDGRVCGLNPVRRNVIRENSGAADSSCVL